MFARFFTNNGKNISSSENINGNSSKLNDNNGDTVNSDQSKDNNINTRPIATSTTSISSRRKIVNASSLPIQAPIVHVTPNKKRTQQHTSSSNNSLSNPYDMDPSEFFSSKSKQQQQQQQQSQKLQQKERKKRRSWRVMILVSFAFFWMYLTFLSFHQSTAARSMVGTINFMLADFISTSSSSSSADDAAHWLQDLTNRDWNRLIDHLAGGDDNSTITLAERLSLYSSTELRKMVQEIVTYMLPADDNLADETDGSSSSSDSAAAAAAVGSLKHPTVQFIRHKSSDLKAAAAATATQHQLKKKDENDDITPALSIYDMLQLADSMSECQGKHSFLKIVLGQSGGGGGAAKSKPKITNAKVTLTTAASATAGKRDLQRIRPGIQPRGAVREKPSESSVWAKQVFKNSTKLKDLCRALPSEQQIQERWGPEPVVVGLETCQPYLKSLKQANIPKPMPRVAGLYHTGTNALAQLLDLNIESLPYADPKQVYLPYDVPWGKHMRPDTLRLTNTIPENHADRDDTKRRFVFPIVIVRDPFFWMESMCKEWYDAKWEKPSDRRCPAIVKENWDNFNTINNQSTYKVNVLLQQTNYEKMDNYSSLPEMWSIWNQKYLEADFPRLMIRFEDVLYRTEQVIGIIRECLGYDEKVGAGSNSSEYEFQYPSSKSKRHGNPTDFVPALAQHATEKSRYHGMKAPDRTYSNHVLDPKLMELFGYTPADVTVSTLDMMKPWKGVAQPRRGADMWWLPGYVMKPGHKLGPVTFQEPHIQAMRKSDQQVLLRQRKEALEAQKNRHQRLKAQRDAAVTSEGQQEKSPLFFGDQQALTLSQINAQREMIDEQQKQQQQKKRLTEPIKRLEQLREQREMILNRLKERNDNSRQRSP